MSLIKRYDPFADLLSVTPTFRLFEDMVNRMLSEPSSSRPWAPAVDILENENELVLKADLPDVNLKDVDIEIENGTLTLKGERKFERKEDSKEGYHRIERSYGAFMRCFALPDSVDTDKVKAEYKNGVLTVTLPKKEIAKPRNVKIEVASN
jgi:HSP20 family protein